MADFESFGKIHRLSREMIITEKLDGSNAQINIVPASLMEGQVMGQWSNPPLCYISSLDTYLYAGSRNRWLTRETDNFGFAKWAETNAEELCMHLGPGRHYGEWWGSGIQRTYGLKEKRFSLFNTHRWSDPNKRPSCCHVVPILWEGKFDTTEIDKVMQVLKEQGSCAAPGFMKPEGVVIYHKHANVLFKKTFEHDEEGKGN